MVNFIQPFDAATATLPTAFLSFTHLLVALAAALAFDLAFFAAASD